MAEQIPPRAELSALFPVDVPNVAMLRAGLTGHVRATVLVDKPDAPAQALVKLPFGVTFLSEGATSDFVAAARRGALSEQRGFFSMTAAQREATAWLPTEGAPIPRWELARPDPDVCATWRARPHNGLRLAPIDAALFERCRWRAEILAMTATVEVFEAQCVALALLAADEILCETYAVFWAPGCVEIGAITHPDYRGQDLAAVTGAFLIERCEPAERTVYWTCHQSNAASARVAAKLGFQGPRPYAFYPWHGVAAPSR